MHAHATQLSNRELITVLRQWLSISRVQWADYTQGILMQGNLHVRYHLLWIHETEAFKRWYHGTVKLSDTNIILLKYCSLLYTIEYVVTARLKTWYSHGI